MGFPLRIVRIINSLYHNFTCSVGSSSLNFQVKTGVSQECVMSAVLCNLVIDRVMRRTTEDQPRGIKWTLCGMLGDFDFADGLALLSQTYQHVQEKTHRLSKNGQQVRLQVSNRKTEVMTLKINIPAPVSLDAHAFPNTGDLRLSGQCCQTGWRHQRGHSEQTEQSQERL